METHAYSIAHIDETNMQTSSIKLYLLILSTFLRYNAPTVAENGLISASDRKNDDACFDNPYNFFHSAGDSIENLSDVNVQLIQETRRIHDDEVRCIIDKSEVNKNHDRKYARTTNGDNTESKPRSVRTLSSEDHVYGEVKMIEWPNDFNKFFDIRDNHRRHSSIKVKTSRYRFSPATRNLREMYESMLQSGIYRSFDIRERIAVRCRSGFVSAR